MSTTKKFGLGEEFGLREAVKHFIHGGQEYM